MGLFSAVSNIVSTGMTNKANAKEAGKSREFTKEQLQNQHQWEVADLRAAGLNPILSANSGAGIGGSAQATMQAPNTDGLDTEGLASSALAFKQMKAELANVLSDTDQKSENLKTQKSQQAANAASASAQSALAGLYNEQKRGVNLENDKQTVLKAPYDLVAPLVDRVSGGIKATGKQIYNDRHKLWKEAKDRPIFKQKSNHTKIDWSKHKKGN